ncbi:unnamed protein product [Albugo candida]|uniref:Uncharacterized protein n=1 Tax=Albugo candida TaxID=65357 RepID=A0A024FV81_9STRA|nr:unnamed protein product [Albugo candida]|eukprot:CCI10554.1 unnamed protein product [Albugo candida]
MVKMCFIQTVMKQSSYKNAYFKRNDICTLLSYILVHCMSDRLKEFHGLLCTIKSTTCYKDPCEIANSRKGLPGSIRSLTNQNVLVIITILIRFCAAWSTIKILRALVKSLSGFDAFFKFHFMMSTTFACICAVSIGSIKGKSSRFCPIITIFAIEPTKSHLRACSTIISNQKTSCIQTPLHVIRLFIRTRTKIYDISVFFERTFASSTQFISKFPNGTDKLISSTLWRASLCFARGTHRCIFLARRESGQRIGGCDPPSEDV